jgi:hypothetical protein
VSERGGATVGTESIHGAARIDQPSDACRTIVQRDSIDPAKDRRRRAERLDRPSEPHRVG